MDPTFVNKEIVWAKVKGYPWWPAEIAKTPSSDANVYKVIFIAQDTHAFLNPKDVRKFTQFYDECSKKKMRGLAPAIQAAEQMHKKRLDVVSKTAPAVAEPEQQKTKGRATKSKPIRKTLRNKKQQDSEHDSESQVSESKSKSKSESQKHESEGEQQVSSGEEMGSESSQEKFVCESEEKVDRNKLEVLEEGLFKIVEGVKQGTYHFSQVDFQELGGLTGEELIHSKITNLLSFILSRLHRGTRQESHLFCYPGGALAETAALVPQTAQPRLPLRHQLLRPVPAPDPEEQTHPQRVRGPADRLPQDPVPPQKGTGPVLRNAPGGRNQQRRHPPLKGTAGRHQGSISVSQERRVEISGASNKAAIDRCIENMIPKYM